MGVVEVIKVTFRFRVCSEPYITRRSSGSGSENIVKTSRLKWEGPNSSQVMASYPFIVPEGRERSHLLALQSLVLLGWITFCSPKYCITNLAKGVFPTSEGPLITITIFFSARVRVADFLILSHNPTCLIMLERRCFQKSGIIVSSTLTFSASFSQSASGSAS